MKEQFIKNLVIAVGVFIDGMRKDMGLRPDTECVGCIMTPGPGSQPQAPPAVTAPGSQTQVPPAVTAPGSQPQMPPAVTAPGSQPQMPPAVTAPGSQPELDSQGIPWDSRIHSSGKTKYASRIDDNKPEGGWVIKKGADINEVIRIRDAYLSTAPGSQTQVPPAVTAPGAPGSQTQVPPAVTAPGAPGSQTQVPATWAQLMRAIVEADIDRTFVESVCSQVAQCSWADLQAEAKKHLIPEIAARLGFK